MPAKNRTGLVETVPASRKLMFIRAPEEGRDADQRADQQAQADGQLAEDDQLGEPGVRAAVDQDLDEAAVPVVGDRRLALRGNERSEEHTSELQSRQYLVCRLLLEKKKIHHDTIL